MFVCCAPTYPLENPPTQKLFYDHSDDDFFYMVHYFDFLWKEALTSLWENCSHVCEPLLITLEQI